MIVKFESARKILSCLKQFIKEIVSSSSLPSFIHSFILSFYLSFSFFFFSSFFLSCIKIAEKNKEKENFPWLVILSEEKILTESAKRNISQLSLFPGVEGEKQRGRKVEKQRERKEEKEEAMNVSLSLLLSFNHDSITFHVKHTFHDITFSFSFFFFLSLSLPLTVSISLSPKDEDEKEGIRQKDLARKKEEY